MRSIWKNSDPQFRDKWVKNNYQKTARLAKHSASGYMGRLHTDYSCLPAQLRTGQSKAFDGASVATHAGVNLAGTFRAVLLVKAHQKYQRSAFLGAPAVGQEAHRLEV